MASPKFGVTDLRGQLDLLLAEGVTTAIERERNTFDQLAGAATKPIVLFGARKLGQKTLAGLRSVSVEPLCFSDNNAALWDTSISGVKVLSPGEAARRFGADAVFVICIWGRGSADSMSERQKQLINLGCRTVTPFVPLFWKYSAAFLPHNALDLPHYVQEQAEKIDFCFEVLSDDKSREEFVRQLTWRLTGDFDALGDPVADEIYFPRFVSRRKSPETFIDCGAYNGDTVLRFISRNQGEYKSILAFEPDPSNLSALNQTISALSPDHRERIRVFPYAVGAQPERVRFIAIGTEGASVGSGDYEVDCVRLDDIVGEEDPTYIKMDIEAAEPDALHGAQNTIRRSIPVIAACSYHVQDHLWTIPLTMSEIFPEYTISLRQHIQLVEDLVSYAVPRDRFDL
ncbi:MAG: FkbM family methyltransferase [Bryobacteraceae bacterium]